MSEPDLDATRTPSVLFDLLNAKYRFAWDLFANEANAKVAGGCFFSKETSAFNCPWMREKWSWANPPYGRGQLPKFVAKAIAEVKLGAQVVALIPATTGTEWFNDRILRPCQVLDSQIVDAQQWYPSGASVFAGYELSMSGIGYRQRVTFLKGRVPFDPPEGWTKPWSPPATDSVLIEWRPPLR